jgi:phage terminase small subunit
MTPRQRSFAEQYVLDHNGAAAAVRAGYAAHSARITASQLLTKPNVRELVAEHEEAAAERLAVTKERVIAELEAAIEIARQKADPMAMIRGWAEIAKLIGAYAPERTKVEISVDGEALQAKFASMSDAELLAIAEGRAE